MRYSTARDIHSAHNGGGIQAFHPSPVEALASCCHAAEVRPPIRARWHLGEYPPVFERGRPARVGNNYG